MGYGHTLPLLGSSGGAQGRTAHPPAPFPAKLVPPTGGSTLQSWQQSPRAHSAPSLSWQVVALQQRSEHSCETGRD